MNIKSVKTVEYVYEVTMVTEVFPVFTRCVCRNAAAGAAVRSSW